MIIITLQRTFKNWLHLRIKIYSMKTVNCIIFVTINVISAMGSKVKLFCGPTEMYIEPRRKDNQGTKMRCFFLFLLFKAKILHTIPIPYIHYAPNPN